MIFKFSCYLSFSEVVLWVVPQFMHLQRAKDLHIKGFVLFSLATLGVLLETQEFQAVFFDSMIWLMILLHVIFFPCQQHLKTKFPCCYLTGPVLPICPVSFILQLIFNPPKINCNLELFCGNSFLEMAERAGDDSNHKQEANDFYPHGSLTQHLANSKKMLRYFQ